MAVNSIQDAKVLIASTRVNDRTNGLKELIHILKHNRGKSSLEDIGNKAYLALCDTLFQCMRDERSAFLRSKKNTNKIALVLTLSATALRQIIDSGVRTIKSSTVESIIDSIIEVLPGKDGTLFEPLLEDLSKAMRELLKYQPHVERLSRECWNSAVDFCIESLSGFMLATDSATHDSWSTGVSSRGRTPIESTDLTGRTSSRDHLGKKQISDKHVHTAEDFVLCLQLLVKASNAPVLDKVVDILNSLLNFLQRKPTRGHSAALAAVNFIFARISLHAAQLTKRTIQELLPSLTQMWSDASLRDEILITLTHTEPHLASLVADRFMEQTTIDLEGLIDVMYADYRRRQESTVLHFLEDDHLCFRHIGKAQADTHPLHTCAFSLEHEHVRCESLWATISAIARFSFMIDDRKRILSQRREDGEESTTKKLRVTRHFHDYLRHVSEPRSNAKRAALQVVAFMVQEGPMDEEDLQSTLERLTACISDENPVHSSWAMVALVSAAFQKSAKEPTLLPYWVSAWQGASRASTSVSSSRAACHLMDVLLRLGVVPYSAVSESMQSMLLSIELSGPALLTEASSSLLTTAMRMRVTENPTHYLQSAERVLNWLISKWTPSFWPERAYSSLNAHHCNARDVLKLLHAVLDRSFAPLAVSPFLVLGPIAQARAQSKNDRGLCHYLLLLDDGRDFQTFMGTTLDAPESTTTEHQHTPLETRILDYCTLELEKSRQRWKEWKQQNPQGITPDMLRIVANSCIIASALSELGDPDDHRALNLASAVDSFAHSCADFLSRRETEQFKVDAMLEVCRKALPDIRNLPVVSQTLFREQGIFQLAKHLSKALDDRQEVKQSFYVEDDDFMDVDDAPNSQLGRAASDPDHDVPRHELAARTELAALRSTCSAYCHLVSTLDHAAGNGLDYIPSDFVQYLLSLPEAELLRSRQFMEDLLSTRLRLQPSSCLSLLDRLGDALIDPRAREYNTSEVANGLVVEVLISTIHAWNPGATDQEGQDLYENVTALYDYYVKEMERGGVRRSISLQKALARFLDGLLKPHPDFGQSRRSPSARTCLFELLAEGEIPLKYLIVQRLPGIFDGFVLSEHKKIFEDIDEILISLNDRAEGTAIALLAFSRLASKWHTLLRQGVYRIFEHSVDHAKRCMEEIARAKDLEDSRALFKLLAPQIIFTWLDHWLEKKKVGGAYNALPFSTFGYDSLIDLLRDIESEAVGQAAMLGLGNEVDYLADQFGISASKLLVRNFGKAAAYTLSWDTGKGNGRDKSRPRNAQLLRDTVGPEQYGLLMQEHFPRVLGHILQTVTDEKSIEKSLEKRPAYTVTAKALAKMTGISHSESSFDLGIEPSFAASYLLDTIERLCRRTGDNPVEFWTPGIYSLVMRMLLDRIHPALGSLHAQSVIRKIRILVALAGNIAYRGYPLQMTLQSLRPFLSNIQTADDTLGIMQYLFDNGKDYLREHLNFMTGIGLSILISIRIFLGTSQESTTQQSQHAATMNKAQRFHAWFTSFLEHYSNTFVEREERSSIKAFRLITTAASRVRTEGNSLEGSEESTLLVQILEDVRSGRRLLNNTSREVALDLLCQNFQPAPTARDDVLGSDVDVARYAPQVWSSCQRVNIGQGYLLWAARVLGRAFGAHGEVKQSKDQSLPWLNQSASPNESSGKDSRQAIIQKIVDLFYSDNRKEVSLAESVIRLLISRLSKDKGSYVAEMTKIIPMAIGEALNFPVPAESEDNFVQNSKTLEHTAMPQEKIPVSRWITDLTVALCATASEEPILGSLTKLLLGMEQMAETLFPYILHLVLLTEFEGQRTVRDTLSEAIMSWCSICDLTTTPHVRILIQAILYLRSQPAPKEVTRVDRDRWLEIDYLQASQAATVCGMHRSALLFAETSSGQPIVKTASRRSSVFVDPPRIPVDLQLSIYKNLDEPDSFYGVERGSSLSSVLDRLEYESDGIKSLLFRGARLDSQFRRSNAMDTADSRGMVKSLITLNMNSVTHSLLSNDHFRDIGDDVIESTLHTARKLGQWDIKAPEGNHSEASTLFKAFQSLHHATDTIVAREQVDRQLLATMSSLAGRDRSAASTHTLLRTLAVLTEADEVISAPHPDRLLDIWDQMKARERWMRAGDFDDVRLLLSCRETLFSVLSSNTALQEALRARTPTIRHMEVEALVSSSTICRRHGALQESLASVTYLSDIVQECKSVGLNIDTTAQHEVASVLWDQGEIETSIRMREYLIEHAAFDSQDTDISLPVLLAKLGHHRAEARLAKPDTIIQENLEPAIRELKGQTQGSGPGQVFHEFALFCDKQLQNPEAAEDLARIKTVMDRKKQEMEEFLALSRTDKSKTLRDTYKRSAARASNWWKLDNAEYERLRKGREQFLRQCLENYLLSLHASDEYNNDALRVFSLWLEYSDTPFANEAIARYLAKVPSGKFALLMNQLSSRLQAETTDFQKLLCELVFRICVDHPYHGMHHIFAIQTQLASTSREEIARSKDESAKSRQRAAHTIASMLGNEKRASAYWKTIYQSDKLYHALAMFKNEADNRQGRELPLDRYPESKAMVQRIPTMHVPPATLQIEVRANCDYSDLPKINRFKSRMSIANGLSAPKIVTAIGTDGKPYKQLFKSGNDDLRQDAIMEQVFDQVSRLLKNHTATRLRNLGIRTYKVLPLSTRSGLMEFVQDTIPLHQWVMPAHEKYYPSDWKNERCRKEIGNVQQDSLTTRVKVWHKTADNFHPVLRYFLLERFQDPDEWFERRTAYTRSTAAISILGHVLGLGDRHCHNILLDEKSGEVVHIDLGVSFEAGRVLPVPEVVPFRLTRDIVDAMGYTKTEGVFQRCCEFMLDTLREEKEAIMTLLNVLRYDPLVNWSVTPTKAKRMQENQDTNAANGHGTRGPPGTPAPTPGPPGSAMGGIQVGVSGVLDADQESHKKREEQAGEAGRALSVVEKKLSKTLSTKATVNELIQQATDERNLAVLYCGWSSYA